MPTETKISMSATNLWKTLMEQTAAKENIIACCQNDLLTTSLPRIKDDLHYCQLRLMKFLDRKRMVHVKFQFLSNKEILTRVDQGRTEWNYRREQRQLGSGRYWHTHYKVWWNSPMGRHKSSRPYYPEFQCLEVRIITNRCVIKRQDTKKSKSAIYSHSLKYKQFNLF